MIKVGDVVYLRQWPEDKATLYKVLDVMGNNYVNKVQVVKEGIASQDREGKVIACMVHMDDLIILGPKLTPKELVCRKIVQMEERFKNRVIDKEWVQAFE